MHQETRAVPRASLMKNSLGEDDSAAVSSLSAMAVVVASTYVVCVCVCMCVDESFRSAPVAPLKTLLRGMVLN